MLIRESGCIKDSVGYTNPPYKTGTPVGKFTLSNSEQYVRVYNPNYNNMSGRWIMRLEDIQGLTAQQIKDKFALENLPTYICDVNISTGTQLHTGIAEGITGWGNGGGLQYDIIGFDYNTMQSWFTNGIPISSSPLQQKKLKTPTPCIMRGV